MREPNPELVCNKDPLHDFIPIFPVRAHNATFPKAMTTFGWTMDISAESIEIPEIISG